jgi:hypothetical protein
MVVHIYNSSTQEEEARKSQVQGQTEPHSKTLSQINKQKEEKKTGPGRQHSMNITSAVAREWIFG